MVLAGARYMTRSGHFSGPRTGVWKPVVAAGRAVLGAPLSNDRIGGDDGFLAWRFARPHRRHRFVPLSNAGDELDRLVKWQNRSDSSSRSKRTLSELPRPLTPLNHPR